jgi:hypothetical protein
MSSFFNDPISGFDDVLSRLPAFIVGLSALDSYRKGCGNDLRVKRNRFTVLLMLCLSISLMLLPSAAIAANAGIAEGASSSSVIRVANAGELAQALQNAIAGNTIVLEDGTYADVPFVIEGKHGSESAPITVRAANQGGVVITGGSYFEVSDSSYIVIQGLSFTNTGHSAVALASSHHIRITRNKFALTENGTTVKWLAVGGSGSHDNRIDHNEFGPRHDPGQMIALDGNGSTEMTQYDVIEFNYFHDIGPRIANGMETIRAGLSGVSQLNGYTTIQYNLFVNCDGDPEFISVKSSGNTVRYNTFINNAGQVTARHGNANRFYGNFFFGDGVKPEVGGFRIYGNDQLLYNNYFENMTYFVLDINSGDFDGGPNADQYTRSDLSKHWRVYRAQVVHNTIVNSTTGIVIGRKYHADKAPVDSVVANNIVWNTKGRLYEERLPSNTLFAGNIGYGSTLDNVPRTSDEIRNVDPLLVTDGGLQKLSAASPAIDAAALSFPFVVEDMEGQSRSVADIGADEYAAGPVLNRPLTPADVGPDAHPTIAVLSEWIDQFEASGELAGPLSAQLRSSVAQAAYQYDKGAVRQAVKHLDDLLKHLQQPPAAGHIADVAATALERCTQSLIEWLKGLDL